MTTGDEKYNISLLGSFNYPHFVIPMLNCSVSCSKDPNSAADSVIAYEPAPYTCSLPVPLDVPSIVNEECLKGIDRVTKLVNDKDIWTIGTEELIARNMKLKSRIVLPTERKNIKQVSREITRLAEHLDLDPDPNFSGFYNWYYSDGCLNNIYSNNTHSLLYGHDSEPGICVVTPVNIKKSKCVLLKDYSSFLRTGQKQNILQISVKDDFVALRQKNFTNIFTITDDRELKFKKIHEHSESKASITSVTISDDLDCTYCTLTTSNKLKLWSPEVKDKCINCVKIKKTKVWDNWGSVKYISNNNILVSARTCVYLKDTRVPLEQNVKKWKIHKKEINKLPCNFISQIMKSNFQDSCAYVGSRHYLFELDFRKGFSKQWTHMMELPPMYGAVNSLNNNSETVFIASQKLNEVIGIDSNLQSMPFILPAPSETLRKVNLQGLCLDPLLSSRFNFSMVGMTVLSDNTRNNRAIVFRNNSVGDIFYQSIVDKGKTSCSTLDRDNSFKLLSKWENNCIKTVDIVNDNPLEVTDIINFHKFNRVFEEGNITSKIKEPSCNKCTWKMPKHVVLKEMNSFTKSLIDVWNSEAEINDSKDSATTEIVRNETQKLTKRKKLLNKEYLYDNSYVNISNQSISRSVNQYKNTEGSLDLFDNVATPKQTNLHLENLNTAFLGEEYDNITRDECNFITPNKVVQKKIVRSGIKKSRFSSGF